MGLLDNKISIITGGANGIGAATARKFASEGATVIIADVDVDSANIVLNECKVLNKLNHIFIKTDATNKRAVEDMVNESISEFGKIDILVNSTGGFLKERMTIDIEESEWDQILSFNLKSAFLCCQAVIPHMISKRYGKIVNISSESGRTAITLSGSHYAAAKSAILGFTRHLAKELAPQGIFVNVVAPGPTLTPRFRISRSDEFIENAAKCTPLGRLSDTTEQANAILFLASDLASHITGVTLDVGGGRFMV